MADKQVRGRSLVREQEERRETSPIVTRSQSIIITKEVRKEREGNETEPMATTSQPSSGDDKGKSEETHFTDMLKQILEKMEQDKIENQKQAGEFQTKLMEQAKEDKLEIVRLLEEDKREARERELQFEQKWEFILQTNISLNEAKQQKLEEKMGELENKSEEKLGKLREEMKQDKQELETKLTENQRQSNEELERQKSTNERIIVNFDMTLIEQNERQNKLLDEINRTDHRTLQNEDRIGKVEQKTGELEIQFNEKTSSIKNTVENLIERENVEFQRMQAEIRKLHQAGVRQFNTETTHYPYLKPEMWPKFKGNNNKLHPMTYLNNVTRLTSDIEDQTMVLNLIRLTLEERALEWYNMISERCQNVQDFKKEFVNQYWNSSQQDRQKVQLLIGKYRENLSTRENYACDLYNRCKYIDGLTETEIARNLLKHFIMTDSQAIICQNVNSMEELMEILRRLDDLSDLQKRDKFNHTYQGPHNNNNGQNGGNNRGKFYNNYRGSYQPNQYHNNNENNQQYNNSRPNFANSNHNYQRNNNNQNQYQGYNNNNNQYQRNNQDRHFNQNNFSRNSQNGGNQENRQNTDFGWRPNNRDNNYDRQRGRGRGGFNINNISYRRYQEGQTGTPRSRTPSPESRVGELERKNYEKEPSEKKTSISEQSTSWN